MKEGGHDVPENIITDWYRMSLLYLRTPIFNFQEVYLIENSTETAEQVAIVKNDKLIYKIEECPAWANKVLYLMEKLESKK